MQAIDAVAQQILDALDPAQITADLAALVRYGPVTGSPAESAAQRHIGASLEGIGLHVDLWEDDVQALRADPGNPGDETDRSELIGMVATTPAGTPNKTPALILVGHVDVVPIGDPDAWSVDPTGARIDGDLLYGRGAADMLAGVAANIAVARAVVASGVSLSSPLALHTVVSEEDGGLGAFATLRRGHTGGAAVITEPTDESIIVASAGALTFRLDVTGLAAHGSDRLSGVSAIELFTTLHSALRTLESRRNAVSDPLFGAHPLPYALSIGTVHSGDWASTVPDRLVAEGRYGVRIGEDPATARAEFEATVRAVCAADPWWREHPVVVTWPGGQFAPSAVATGHPLVTELADTVRAVRGRRPPVAAAPYGCDQRHYTGAGIPTVVYGPGQLREAHAPDEKVSLTETLAVARTLAVLVARRCGAH